jgi:hypothetical protein
VDRRAVRDSSEEQNRRHPGPRFTPNGAAEQDEAAVTFLARGTWPACHGSVARSKAMSTKPASAQEIIGAFDVPDISGRDALAKRPVFGINYYVMQHRLKFQFMQRETFNVLGISDERSHSTFVQAQFIY